MRTFILTALLLMNSFFTATYAQRYLTKWEEVINDGFKSVSIDTTSIIMKGKQISFWIQEEFENPQEFSESQLKIKKIKSYNPAKLLS